MRSQLKAVKNEQLTLKTSIDNELNMFREKMKEAEE
jgi:hypothetical protein